MRSIELSLPTIEILKAHKERQNLEQMVFGNAWQDTGYIFTKEDGSPIDPTRPYFIFKRALQELNRVRSLLNRSISYFSNDLQNYFIASINH